VGVTKNNAVSRPPGVLPQRCQHTRNDQARFAVQKLKGRVVHLATDAHPEYVALLRPARCCRRVETSEWQLRHVCIFHVHDYGPNRGDNNEINDDCA